MSPEELELRPVSKFIEIAEHIGQLLGYYSDYGDPNGDDSSVKQARECREEAMKLAWKLEALVSQSVEFSLEMDLDADAVNQHLGDYSSMIRNFGDWGSVEERDEWGGYANRIVWQGPTFDELRECHLALKREPLFLTLIKAEPRQFPMVGNPNGGSSKTKQHSHRLTVEKVQGSERRFKIDRKPVTLSPACANLLNAFITLIESGEPATPANLMAKASTKYSHNNRKAFEDDKRRLNAAMKRNGIVKGLYVVGDVFQLCKPPKTTPTKAVNKNGMKTVRRR